MSVCHTPQIADKAGLIALYNFARRTGIDLDIAAIDQQVPYSMSDPLNDLYMRTVYRIGYQKARALVPSGTSACGLRILTLLLATALDAGCPIKRARRIGNR